MFRNLEAELVRKGISKATLANELKINPGTLSQRMAGRVDFGLGEALKIRELLGVDTDLEELFDSTA